MRDQSFIGFIRTQVDAGAYPVVFDGEAERPVAYTVGLWLRASHPELAMFGDNAAHLARVLKASWRHAENSPIAAGHPFMPPEIQLPLVPTIVDAGKVQSTFPIAQGFYLRSVPFLLLSETRLSP
jgi:hypothetical protein